MSHKVFVVTDEGVQEMRHREYLLLSEDFPFFITRDAAFDFAIKSLHFRLQELEKKVWGIK